MPLEKPCRALSNSVMKIYEALLKTSLRGQRDLSGLTSFALSQEIHFAETKPKAVRTELACKGSSHALGTVLSSVHLPSAPCIWAGQLNAEVPSRVVATKMVKGSCLAKVFPLNNVKASTVWQAGQVCIHSSHYFLT